MSLTMVITTIPGRENFLLRSFNSVVSQTLKPNQIFIQVDKDKLGAAGNRDKAIYNCNTDYIAFLDDDDQLMPNHLEVLFNCIKDTESDLVYPSWLTETGSISHLDIHMGVPWDNNNIHQVPITWMAKTNSLKDVGGFSSNFDPLANNCGPDGHRIGEDFLMINKLVEAGKKIYHINEKTWIWNLSNPGSTQGKPDRW